MSLQPCIFAGVLKQVCITLRCGKIQMPKKIFGVFEHTVLSKHERLVRGFDELYYVPHSRHTDINMEQLQAVPELNILTASKEAGFA